jgi:hypothetical protein
MQRIPMGSFLCIEHGEPIMMFSSQDEILSSCISNKVNPGLSIPVLGCEVGEEIVIDDIGSVGVELMVVDVSFVGIAVVPVPPVPFCVDFPWGRVSLLLLVVRVTVWWARAYPSWNTVWSPV